MESKNKQRLIDLITRSQSGLDSHIGTFREYFNAYHALLDPKALKYLEDKGKSKTPTYYIMTKLQRIRADFIEAYFTNKQFAKISEKPTLKGTYYNPISGEQVPFSRQNYSNMNIQAINALQNAVDYYTTEDEKCNLFDELSKAFDGSFIYGTAALKVWWDNGIKIEYIDIKDIKYDPEAKGIDSNKFKVHDIEVTVDDIIKYQEQGIFLPDIDLNKIAPDAQNNRHKRIKLQEVYELKDDELYISTLFDKNIVLREETKVNVSDPITVGKIKNQIISPDGDTTAVRTYGDSIIGPLIPIQREMTILKNQQLDIVDRQLNPRYISNDAKLNPFDFSNQKQLVIQGDHNKVKELQAPNMRDSVFNLDRLSIEGQEAIGVTDYNSGSANNKQMNNTATGISILTSESNKILAHYLRNCNETLIKPLFRKITELIWMYGDAKFFYGIDRTQELEYQVGVDVGLGATNKEQQLQSKMTAFKGMMDLATTMQDPMRMQKAEKFYYKEILPLMGIENYEEYYQNEQAGNPEQPGEITGHENVGIHNELLGAAESGPTATSIPE
jgi:hypothetical protein